MAVKLIGELNAVASKDPLFIDAMLQPVAVIQDANLVQASAFQFSNDPGGHCLSALGMLNGMFGDRVYICLVTDDDSSDRYFGIIPREDVSFEDFIDQPGDWL